jgi:hypothetical protein
MRKKVLLIAALLFLITPVHSWALSLTIDTTLYEDDGDVLDENLLTGTADLTITRTVADGGDFNYSMTILLTNTSLSDAVQSGASASRLTGIGITLPDSLDILSGSVMLGAGSTLYYGTTAHDWSADSDPSDLSGEWGYLNGNSGHYHDAGTTTNTQISTMVADASDGGVENPFDASRVTTIDGQITLDGPPMGLISSAYDASIVGNWKILDSILITTVFSGSGTMNAAALESYINGGEVVLTFGSPSQVVPEPSTYLLLGSGLAGLALWRRKRLTA